MKHGVSLLLIGVLLALWAAPASAQVDECMQRGGIWDPNTARCEVGATIEVTINYPVLLAQNPIITKTVDQFLLERRQAFLGPAAEYGFFSMSGKLALDINFAASFFNERILTLTFTVYEFTGGAHGLTTITTFTFDIAAQRLLSLDELFQPGTDYLAVIAPLAQQSLAAQLGDMLDADWLAQGTAPVPENYAAWAISQDALTFTFQQYQVAPYAAGLQTVSIPLGQLAGLLAPPFNGPLP